MFGSFCSIDGAGIAIDGARGESNAAERPHRRLSCDTKPSLRLTLGTGDLLGGTRMHWHIYAVLAVGGLCMVILDLVLGRWARAGMVLLLSAGIALQAWNGREEERKARAAELDAGDTDASRE